MQKSPGASSLGLRSYILFFFDYAPLIKFHYSIPNTIIFIVETKKPEKSRQKAAGCRNTQEVIYTQPLFITPFYLLKGYRSDRLDINIPVIPKAARRDGFTR